MCTRFTAGRLPAMYIDTSPAHRIVRELEQRTLPAPVRDVCYEESDSAFPARATLLLDNGVMAVIDDNIAGLDAGFAGDVLDFDGHGRGSERVTDHRGVLDSGVPAAADAVEQAIRTVSARPVAATA